MPRIGVKMPKLVRRLREELGGSGNLLIRRAGWKLEWDVRRSSPGAPFPMSESKARPARYV